MHQKLNSIFEISGKYPVLGAITQIAQSLKMPTLEENVPKCFKLNYQSPIGDSKLEARANVLVAVLRACKK